MSSQKFYYFSKLILAFLDAPTCTFFAKGICPRGNECPDKHIVQNADKRIGSIVCKHWLRGLCKKGDQCEFLHEYNIAKMPECKIPTHFPEPPGTIG